MCEKFDVMLSIREDLLKALILGIEARLPAANILSFAGFSHQVTPIMQQLSHGTRAFLHNSNNLSGFLVRLELMRIMNLADDDQWQEVNLETLKTQLEIFGDIKEQRQYLSMNYPYLYMYMIRYLNQQDELERYSKECLEYKDNTQ